MPNIDIKSVNHRCMNCMEPMHGALCGALFAEKEASIKISYEVLSPNGQSLFTSPTALICHMCIKSLDGASLKSPQDARSVASSEDPDYRPVQTMEDSDSDLEDSRLSADAIEVIGVVQGQRLGRTPTKEEIDNCNRQIQANEDNMLR